MHTTLPPLPASWVEELFARLTVRYGAPFLQQYHGLDMGLIKADWGNVLAGFSRETIAYAVGQLPAVHAPNALQFRDLCKARPTADVLALPAPKASPGLVRAALARLKRPVGERSAMSAAAYCIHRVYTSPSAKKHGLSQAQRDMVESCKRVLSETDKDHLTALGYAGLDGAVVDQVGDVLQDERAMAERKQQAAQAVQDYAAANGLAA